MTKKKNNSIKSTIEDNLYNVTEDLQDKAGKSYDALINRLKYERDGIERELKHEYRNARKYVRANPEYSLGIAFLAGLTLGVLLTVSARD